jgi:AhpD family alkylhydroperoxidase
MMQGPSQLSSGERELIASYVSDLNNCEFCHESHSACANVHLNDNGDIVSSLKSDFEAAPVSDKMKALLTIAERVQKR